MNHEVSRAALDKLAELLLQGRVIDRMYADSNGGINFRANFSGLRQGRWHITNSGLLLSRNPPDDPLGRSGIRSTEYLDYYGKVTA